MGMLLSYIRILCMKYMLLTDVVKHIPVLMLFVTESSRDVVSTGLPAQSSLFKASNACRGSGSNNRLAATGSMLHNGVGSSKGPEVHVHV